MVGLRHWLLRQMVQRSGSVWRIENRDRDFHRRRPYVTIDEDDVLPVAAARAVEIYEAQAS